MNRLSDLLMMNKEEVRLLLYIFDQWWIPQIKTAEKEDLVVWDDMSKKMKCFLEE